VSSDISILDECEGFVTGGKFLVEFSNEVLVSLGGFIEGGVLGFEVLGV